MSNTPERPSGTAGAAQAADDARATGTGDAGTGATTGRTGSTAATATSTPGYQRGTHRGNDWADDEYSGRGAAAMGGTLLAATLMILTGLVNFFSGITGVIKGSFFTTVANYPFYFSVRGRGWVELALGALLFAAGVCLLLGMGWARILGIVLAVFSAIANFMFLPYYPIWSLIVIALDVFIIWALATRGHRRQPV
jgi:hypothetical protein